MQTDILDRHSIMQQHLDNQTLAHDGATTHVDEQAQSECHEALSVQFNEQVETIPLVVDLRLRKEKWYGVSTRNVLQSADSLYITVVSLVCHLWQGMTPSIPRSRLSRLFSASACSFLTMRVENGLQEIPKRKEGNATSLSSSTGQIPRHRRVFLLSPRL